MYQIVNGALKDSNDYKIDDYPVNKKENKKLIAKVDTAEISHRVSDAVPFAGTDELRPAMTGVCLKFGTGMKENSVKVISTNAHILMLSYLENSKVEGGETVMLVQSPKFLSQYLDAVTDPTVTIEANESIAWFVSDSMMYSSRLIDAKAPNYEDVIDNNVDTYMQFDSVKLISIINSIKGEDAKKRIYLDFEGNRDKGYVSIKLGEYKKGNINNHWTDGFVIEKDLKIDVDCKVSVSEKPFLKNEALIMPIMTGDSNFAFDMKYLKVMLTVCENKFYFDSNKPAPQFRAELRPVEVVKSKAPVKVVKAEKPVETKKIDKADAQATIDALQFLADEGNAEAKDTIESLKFLI